MNKINENNGHVYKSKVIELDSFTMESGNSMRRFVNDGYTPFYLSESYDFVEILLDDKYNPYTIVQSIKRNKYGRPLSTERKVSLSNKPNPWGNIYLITKDDLNNIQPMINNIQNLMKLIDEKKSLLIQLIGSTLTDAK